MGKSMIKIYIVLAVSIALCLIFAPMTLGYTSALASNQAVRVQLLSNKHAAAAASIEETAHIVFIMDDGWDTQYTQGYALLKRYDYPGCIAVIPAAVDTEGYMSYANLADLYIDGWDMLNHTYNHEALTGLDCEEQAQQMIRARDWLDSHMLSRGSNIVVFPGGEFDQKTLHALSDEGFIAGRSLKSLWTVKAGCSLENVEVCNILPGLSFDYVQAAIDKAIRNRSTLLIVVHKLESVTDDQHMQVSPEDLARIVDYVHEHEDQLAVVTLSQFVAGF